MTTTKTTNAERLRKLMSRNRLTRYKAAQLAGVTGKAVDSWLAPVGAASHRAMPDRALKLIELELKNRGKK